MRPRLLVQARGHDAAEQVAAHESAQARQKLGRPWPPQFPLRQAVAAQCGRDERRVRQRLRIQAAEEVVHGRIARHQHLAERLFAQHSPQHLANKAAQLTRAAQIVLQAAHDIGPVAGLRIERGLHAQHFAGGEIHHLGHQRGGTQVDYRTAPGARFNGHPRFVGEHRQRPLVYFHHDASRRGRAAGEAPAIAEFLFAKREPHRRRDRHFTFQHAHFAAAAGTLATAREFDPGLKQPVGQRLRPAGMEF